MRSFGAIFGLGVAAGILLFRTLLPCSPGLALGTAAAIGAAAGVNLRAAVLVPIGLGLARAAVVQTRSAERRIERPRLLQGTFEVHGREGGGLRIGAGARRLLLRDPPPDLPPCGHRWRGTLLAEPFRSRADPAAFRAETWAANRGLGGRARVLGAIEILGPSPGAESSLRRLGERARRTARRTIGAGDPDGDLVLALLLGERDRLGAETREVFRRAGLAHVLALSGLHVGLLALGLGAVLRAVGMPHRLTAIPVVLFLATFAAWTGARPPVLRAAGTAGLAWIARSFGRRPAAVGALGWVGGAVLVARPGLLDDPGFRLSFLAAGVLALSATRARSARAGRRRARGLRTLLAAVGISTLITAATFPEVARSFGRVSMLSPLTNLGAGLPTAAALGWGGLAAFVPVPEEVRRRWGAAARRSAAALGALAQHASRLPGGTVRPPAPGPGVSLLLPLLAAYAAAGRRPGPRGRTVLLGASFVAMLESLPAETVTVLDVGQGSALLVTGAGRSALVDGGPPAAPEREPFLPRAIAHRGCGVPDVVVVTHADADHRGGLSDLARAGRIPRLLVPARRGREPAGLAGLTAGVRSRGGRVEAAGPLQAPAKLLGGRLAVCAPWTAAGAPAGIEENERSLVARWQAGGASLLATGDLGGVGERALRAGVRASALRAGILIAGHHGARTSTGTELLETVRPGLVIVSCGAGNPHGHPHVETLERIAAAGSGLLRTDRDGTITLRATPRGFRVRWVRGYPGPRSAFPPFPLSRRSPFS